MSRQVVRVFLVLVLVGGLFTLPYAPATAQAVPRQLRIAVGIDADTLDPAGTTTTTVGNMINYFYETLVGYDTAKSEIVPSLATRWQVSRDGLTYTFTLRRGVAFHDGTPMNAAAVKFTLERLLDPKVRVALRGLYTPMKTIEAVGEDTVRITLSQPSPGFLANLTIDTAQIVSPAAVARAGDRFTVAPIGAGTGPYIFKEWRRGDSILVERNPNYWGKKPVFEEVVFRVVPDAGTRLTQLLAGDVHMAMLPPAPDVKGLRKNPRVNVIEAPSIRVIFLLMNNRWGPFKDARVRQAMNYAINKKAILASILFDLGTVVDSPCVPAQFGYHKVQEGGYPFNPIKAKQLLAEAGYKDGFEFDFFAPTGRYIQDFQFAQAVAAQLRNVNIRANVSTMDWPSYVGMLVTPFERTRVQMVVLGWAWPVLDCEGILFGQFHSSQHPPGGLAPSYYKNERVDELINKARSEPDANKRKDLFKEAQTTVWNEAPWVFLWSQKWYVATVKNLEGVVINPIEKWDALCEPGTGPRRTPHCMTWK
ncbi:MAG: ABC transporter substrate-binding protein [Armatimonadetes bacterium]|nr:ABC transporter substrate-binding protein [Armatimonadota bacterium]